MSEYPLVVISILNWNGWGDTLDCLESVRQLDYPNYLTVVADNASWNDSVERIRAWRKETLPDQAAFVEYTRETAFKGGELSSEAHLDAAPSPNRLVLIANEENLGFSAGHNLVIDYAMRRGSAAGYVFLLNNDATVEPGCLLQLVSVARRRGAGLVGARIRSRASGQLGFSAWCLGMPLLREFFNPLLNRPFPRLVFEDGSARCYTVHGAAMLISTATLKQICGFRGRYLDPALFMYADELELGDALQRVGHQAWLAEHAVVCHKDSGSSGAQFDRPLFNYYSRRNIILLAKRLLPAWSRWPFHVWNLAICLKRIAENVLCRRPQAARAIAWGWIDGYRGVAGRWREHDRQAEAGSLQAPTQHQRHRTPAEKGAAPGEAVGTGAAASVGWGGRS